MRTFPTWKRRTAAMLLLAFTGQVLHPTAAWALTSGPAQPEFASFEPVTTTEMVNLFTGDFTYNLPVLEVPGPEGSGYAISLSYHSGASPEEEASWVGHGWTLNPGAINRQVRGVADDWYDKEVTYHSKAFPNATVSLSTFVAVELGSYDLGLNANGTMRYNNYTGYGLSYGAGVSFASGTVSLGFQVNDGEGSFSLAVNPGAKLNEYIGDVERENKKDAKKYNNLSDDAKKAESGKALKDKVSKTRRDVALMNMAPMPSAYGTANLIARSFPLATTNMTGTTHSLGFSLNGTFLPIEMGVNGNVTGRLAIQRNEDYVVRNAYGYLYTDKANGGYDVQDYHSEETSPYNKRDKYLPPVFADADPFTATGEGIVGGMRFFASTPRDFRPAESRGTTTIVQIGAEGNAGLNSGGGVDIGIGLQELLLGTYSNGGSGTAQAPELDMDHMLRMSGDAGGHLTYGDGGQEAEDAGLSLDDDLPQGYREATFTAPAIATAGLNAGGRPGRSSHVGFNTNERMADKHRCYERKDIVDLTNGTVAHRSSDELIGELSVVNASGQRYNYGLPVMAKNEKVMSHHYPDQVGPNDVTNQWTTATINGSEAFVEGHQTSETYATQYLLTSILQPDYLDRAQDGPTEDDFGGYTRFIYERVMENYHWRLPYIGYSHRDPLLSECYDNRVSYSSGDKEIYYLKEIRTKTHRALFKTIPRDDGFGAAPDQQAGSGVVPSPPVQLQALERIDLYQIDQDVINGARPIRTVRFAYADQDKVWPNVPNSVGQEGKLTLTKVWMEHNGVVPATIAPYTFHYTYPTAAYPAPYAGLHPDPNNTLNETPDYGPACTDAWGNYYHDGADRYRQRRPWLDQDPPDTFDPAAHQLKRIVLPSGGEIHVQYEADDYAFVQNERAHVMVPLTSYDGATCVVDLDAVHGTNAPRAAQLAELLYTAATSHRKMRFDFAFKLTATGTFDPEGSNRLYEIISGYGTIHDIDATDPDEVEIEFKSGDHSTPKKVCQDLVKKEKRGKDLNEDCASYPLFSSDPVSHGTGGPEQLIRDLASFIVPEPSACEDVEAGHSYLRLPVPVRKLGGGLRVKRLLMVEPGTSGSGHQAVYGSEYTYTTKDDAGHVISSGVATYEPAGLDMENPLVRPLDRYHQSWLDKAIAGRDRKQSEGPFGASAYPQPSVGYAQVIVSNIHQGLNAPAYSVHEFHTAREHPVRADLTEKDERNDKLNLTTGIVNIMRENCYVSQGHTLHLNDMHGKPKRQATYAGRAEDHLDVDALPVLQSYTSTDYFPIGELVPVLTKITPLTIEDQPLGQEMDVAVERRHVRDRMNDGTVELDIGVSTTAPYIIPSFSGLPTVSHVSSQIKTHITTKLVKHTGIVRGTTTFKDGILHVTRHLAYDAGSGEPVISRTHDGFLPLDIAAHPEQLDAAGPGTYTSVGIPAHFIYPDMGQKAKGERYYVGASGPGMEISNTGGGVIHLSPPAQNSSQSICDLLNALCIGDLLELTVNSSTVLCHVTGTAGNDIQVVKASYSPNPIPSAAVVNALQIIQSGCNNTVSKQAGAFTYYGNGTITTSAVNADRVALAAALSDALCALSAPGSELLQDIPNIGNFQFQTDPGCATPSGDLDLLILDNHGNTVINFKGCTIDLGPPNCTDGAFGIDPVNGQLLFYPEGNDCRGVPVTCLQFCEDDYPVTQVTRVVSTSAMQYAHDWSYDPYAYRPAMGNANPNDFEAGIRGRWRPRSQHAYRAALTPGSANYDQGMFDMQLFNWRTPQANPPEWVRTDSMLAYSPDGPVLEQLNALNVPSCARYGYDRNLPVLTAQNTYADLVLFESFETINPINGVDHLENQVVYTGSAMEAHGDLDATVAHAGKGSNRTDAATAYLYQGPTMKVPLPWAASNPSFNMLVKAWVRAEDGNGVATDPLAVSATISHNNNALSTVPMERVARTGEWVLMAATLPVTTSELDIDLSCVNAAGMKTWVDDVRMQPETAQMTCYVYDPLSHRLLTSFDDQHFGLIYQYNDEGKLVRKLVETERGIRTVQETQYHTPLTEPNP